MTPGFRPSHYNEVVVTPGGSNHHRAHLRLGRAPGIRQCRVHRVRAIGLLHRRQAQRGIGAMYFTSGPGTLKSRNRRRTRRAVCRCACVASTWCWRARPTGSSTLERVAAVYRTGGWPASVEGNALTAPYSAPSAGPPPWHLYRLTLHTAVGVASTEPHGATRRPLSDGQPAAAWPIKLQADRAAQGARQSTP